MATKFGGKQRRGLASGDPERSPAPLHYVVVKDGARELEVLRVSSERKGGVLPVFSAGWAAHGYLFAEAPGGGWYVRAYTPNDLISLLVGPRASVEWVALDPRPGPRSGDEAATVMPRENFVDYLLGLTRPFPTSAGDFEATEGGVAWARSSVAEDRSLVEVTMLLDVAISRSRGSSLLDGRTKEPVCGCRKVARQELVQLAEPPGAANGDADKEVTTMWSKLFGGGDRLPREKVDAVVRVIDRYLAEEAELRRLQSEKQTVHPKDLPPDKRRALIEEVFAVLAYAKKK